jgi:murein tripeptide amidase MpaA
MKKSSANRALYIQNIQLCPESLNGFIILILMLGLLVFSGASYPSRKNSYGMKSIIGVSLQDYRDFQKTSRQSLDRLYISNGIGYFLVDEGEVILLQRSGLNILSIRALPSPPSRQNKNLSVPSREVNGAYHSYSEVNQFLEDLASQFPDKTALVNLGRSVEGREIRGIKISDNASTEENEPNIYFLGCHHAREWISVEIPLLFARHLLNKYSTNPTIRTLVNQSQIYIIPLVNPDGLEFSIYTYRMWRKNRKYHGNFTWGVDLNRNYGYQWGYDDEGSSPDPSGETYRGSSPFSEPETAAVRNFMLTNIPAGCISFHNYGYLILYPWGYTGTPCPHDEEFSALAKEMGDRIFEVNGRLYEYGSGALAIYPTNGDTDDWIYGKFGVPAFTIELPYDSMTEGGFITSEEEIYRTFAEMLPAMLYFSEHVIARNPVNITAEKPADKGWNSKIRKPNR